MSIVRRPFGSVSSLVIRCRSADNVHLSVELQSGDVSVDTSDVDLHTDNDSTVAVAVTKLQAESSTTWPSSLQVLTLDNTGTTK